VHIFFLIHRSVPVKAPFLAICHTPAELKSYHTICTGRRLFDCQYWLIRYLPSVTQPFSVLRKMKIWGAFAISCDRREVLSLRMAE
jgi:hypothetical protein